MEFLSRFKERPTAWDVKDKPDLLSVSSDGLKVNYTGSDVSAVTIQANHPIPSQCKLFYFEVDIINEGRNGAIWVGFCEKKGWKNKSWGYHSNNGKFFLSSEYGEPYGPLFTTGDTIGCYLNLKKNIIFYTKNGIQLGIPYLNKILKGTLYPCIGLGSQDASVEVNFNYKKFKYAAMNDDDIDESLKNKWSDRLTNYSESKIIYFFEFLTKLLKADDVNTLKYQAKFYFVIGEYKQAFGYLSKLIKLEPNDPFAWRYRGEIHHIMNIYGESLVDLDKLLEININETSHVDLKKLLETNSNIEWIINTYEEVARKQCEECNQQYDYTKWCQQCNSKHFQNYFEKWTSKDIEIDEILQKVQLNADSPDKIMEWIPYNRLLVKKYINEGGFGTIYLANWLDGAISFWINKHQKWYRNTYQPVALKILKNSSNLPFNLLKEEVKPFIQMVDNNFFVRCLGFSQDPKTSNYIIVMEFASLGSLYVYLNNNMTWKDRVVALLDISIGLNNLHKSDIIHQDFHPGNLLFNNEQALLITDFGLCNPASQNSQSNNIYGVMPYVAPEVLKEKSYTKAADIYSFGMIMYFVATGRQPFSNCAHDHNLAIQICSGIRPEINKQEAPQCYIDLMKKCWDSDPNNRPNASEIKNLIGEFYYSTKHKDEINKQFEEAEEYRIANPLFIKDNQPITHPQAIYTSRLLNPFTKDLSKYNSLIIDFTKLSINNENNQPKE